MRNRRSPVTPALPLSLPGIYPILPFVLLVVLAVFSTAL